MMRPYHLEAKIVWVGSVKTFGSNGFQKRTFVMSPNGDARYPTYMAFDLLGGSHNMTSAVTEEDVGRMATVDFYMTARRFDNKQTGETNWFPSNQCVMVSVARGECGATEKAQAQPSSASQTGQTAPISSCKQEESCDLPF